jgi:O-antigen ligase
MQGHPAALVALGFGGISILTLAHPEIALPVFLAAGSIKLDPRLPAFPIDPTVVLGTLLWLSIVARLVIRSQPLRIPNAYCLYIPLLFMMLVSLLYTPDITLGLDKFLRFLVLTGIAIVSPLVILQSPQRLTGFLTMSVIVGLTVGLNSFAMLGGKTKLAAPSGDSLALGYLTGSALAIVLAMLPELSLPRRCVSYSGAIVLLVALVGSGARGATMGVGFCVILSLLFCRKLLGDFAILGVLGGLVLSQVSIPMLSTDNFATLGHPHEAAGMRSDLMALGTRLAMEHPFGGVGIAGYPFYAPSQWNYSHNVILEIGAELGVPAALAYLGMIYLAFRETIRQLRDRAFRYRTFSRVILALLAVGLVGQAVSGDINDNRAFWLYLGLPFVLREMDRGEVRTRGLLLDKTSVTCSSTAREQVAQPNGLGSHAVHNY